MAINRDRLNAIADRARRIAVPIRTCTVSIRKATWSGDQVGDGTATFGPALALPTYVKVREITSKEVAASGGKFEEEDLMVGPITPSFGSGGLKLSDIIPDALSDKEAIEYTVAGAVNGIYRLFGSTEAKPFRCMLTLRRTRKTP